MDRDLHNAACNGDVEKLYKLLGKNPDILDLIDKKEIVETPLHVAASRGHINFAVEVMRLKPSFSKKLDGQGWSPMHVALEKGQTSTVLRFLETEHGAELVRVKGREGVTPLHYVVQQGDLQLLREFLSFNPSSIIDATNHGETALHIAVKKRNFNALDVLLAVLRRSWNGEAIFWEEKVLNWKDEQGYTVLHVAAEMNQLKMVRSLLKCNIHVNAKSLSGSTALDIVTRPESDEYTEMKNLLTGVGARDGPSVPTDDKDTTSMKQLSFKSRLSPVEKIIRFIKGRKQTSQRNHAILC